MMVLVSPAEVVIWFPTIDCLVPDVLEPGAPALDRSPAL